jgi:hypothetical protein
VIYDDLPKIWNHGPFIDDENDDLPLKHGDFPVG